MRIRRHTQPGRLTHVISNFVDRHWYLSDELERQTYLEWLGRALRRSDWRCIAYALMSSHIHLAFLPGKSPLESWS